MTLRLGPSAWVTEDHAARLAKASLARERAEAEADGDVSTTDRYGLVPDVDEGVTCPGVPPVIGVSARWDWQDGRRDESAA